MRFKRYDTYEEWKEKDPEGLQKSYEDYKDDYLFQSLKMERAGMEMLEGRLSVRQFVDMRLAVRNDKIARGKAPTSLNDAIVKRQAYGDTSYTTAQHWAQLYKQASSRTLGWGYRQTIMQLRQADTRRALLQRWKAQGVDVSAMLNEEHDAIMRDYLDQGFSESEANREAHHEVSRRFFGSK